MEVSAFILWTLVGAALTAGSAVVFNRTLPRLSFRQRALLATSIAFLPVMVLVAIAVLPSGGAILLRLSSEEFLVPLAIQVSMILVVSAPIAWSLSRKQNGEHELSRIFE